MNNPKHVFLIDREGKILEIKNDVSENEFAKQYSQILHIDLTKVYERIKQIKPEYKNVNLEYKDLLIDILGYVLYSYCLGKVNIEVPDVNMNYQEVNQHQIYTILDCLKKDNEPPFILYNAFIEEDKYSVMKPKNPESQKIKRNRL